MTRLQSTGVANSILLLLLPAVVLLSAPRAEASQSSALWHVVHDLCVPARRLTGLSFPCLKVDLREGYAITPDPGARYDLLIAPTRRVSGVEDPQLLEADAPNYWRFAWAARLQLAERLNADLPDPAVGMAVNAIQGRSQNQLHIHLSCVRADVARTLAEATPALTDMWSRVAVAGETWRALRLSGAELTADPFKLLATDPEVRAEMGRQTVVVIGARLPDGGPGFYVLSHTADPRTHAGGHGEYLLDESCAAFRARAL